MLTDETPRRRSLSPGERLQREILRVDAPGAEPSKRVTARREATRPVVAIVRLVLDYVLDDREHIAHAIDVVEWWTRGQASDEGVVAARESIRGVASRADERDERCAWLAVQAVVALLDVALEPWWELAGKRARDLVGYVLEALCWPDPDDPAAVADASERLHEEIDRALDEKR